MGECLSKVGDHREEYWSGLPFPSPRDLPNLGLKPGSLTLQANSLPSEPPGNPHKEVIFPKWKRITCHFIPLFRKRICRWPLAVAAAAAAAAKTHQSCLTLRPNRRQPTRLPCPWESPGKNTRMGCHCLLQCMKVKSESEVTQSCPTLSDPMDYSLPGSSIHGILQARVLEWGAIAFSDDLSTLPKYVFRLKGSWILASYAVDQESSTPGLWTGSRGHGLSGTGPHSRR